MASALRTDTPFEPHLIDHGLSDLFAIIADMETTRLLAARLADLLRNERTALLDFLLALGAFDQDRRWEELEDGSLFDFLHRELGLSRGAAFYRSTAARLAREFPDVRDALADGRLCLMTVGEVSKVLMAVNAADVLPRFFHASSPHATGGGGSWSGRARGSHRRTRRRTPSRRRSGARCGRGTGGAASGGCTPGRSAARPGGWRWITWSRGRAEGLRRSRT
jgi:hypothetical protein